MYPNITLKKLINTQDKKAKNEIQKQQQNNN